MKRRNISEVLANLPAFCAAEHPTDCSPILIKRGESGYWPAPGVHVATFNRQRGISAAQVEAMLVGSLFGFDCPGADPLNH